MIVSMGCLDENHIEDSNLRKLINDVHDMFHLLHQLEVTSSPWKNYDPPNLKKLFRVLDTIVGTAVMDVDQAKERYENNDKTRNEDNRSLLENLLDIDEQTARIMALDMPAAGIDTVDQWFCHASSNNITESIACHGILAQDANHFPEPKKFIAERWLRENTTSTSAKGAHLFAYLPFEVGPRSCIGRRFAELEIETLALKVLRNSRLEWTNEPLKAKIYLISTTTLPLEFKLTEL